MTTGIRISIRRAAPIAVKAITFRGGLIRVEFFNGGSHWYQCGEITIVRA